MVGLLVTMTSSKGATMLYIKIGEEKYPCKIGTFTTQFGNDAIRIIGEVPLAENGFLIVDESDNIIADKSEYTYLYREDDTCKEYTEVAEEQIPTQSFYMGDLPPSGYDILSRRISAVNSRVSDITPYEQTKMAYYGENEKVFYGVPDGVLTVTFDNYDGHYTVNRIEDRVTVSFPRLTNQTNITIVVQ